MIDLCEALERYLKCGIIERGTFSSGRTRDIDSSFDNARATAVDAGDCGGRDCALFLGGLFSAKLERSLRLSEGEHGKCDVDEVDEVADIIDDDDDDDTKEDDAREEATEDATIGSVELSGD